MKITAKFLARQRKREPLPFTQQRRSALLSGEQLAFFASGATLEEARARFRFSQAFWCEAITDAESRGWVHSPGAGGAWFLTLRGMVHAEFPPKRVA